MTEHITPEQADLLEILRTRRAFLRFPVQGLDDEQASRRSTVSELTLAGLIKHVAATEAEWATFIVEGPDAAGGGMEWSEETVEEYAKQFRMLDGETLDSLLAEYERVARVTDELVLTVDLDARHPLPTAPWYEPGSSRSNRQVFLHVAAETAQHAGHADIIREAIDGQKSMG